MSSGPSRPGRRLVALLAVGVSLGACGDDEEGIGEDTLDRCTDNIDNDHDGLVDCRDPRCSIFARCAADDDGGPDGDADADSDADSDADTDADSDSDSDADSDGDVDSGECSDEEEAAGATYDTDEDPKTPEETVSDIAESCARSCLGGGWADLCVADCVVEATENAISRGCANCYEDSAYCAASECLNECLGKQDGPDCLACRCEGGCVEIFEDCAGLTSPTKCP